MLKTRLITAAIALPILIIGILKAEHQYFVWALSAVAAMGVLELMFMYRAGKVLSFAAAAMAAGCVMAFSRGELGEGLLLSMLALGALRLFVKKQPEGALADMAPALLGLLYIAGLLTYQVTLHKTMPALVLYLYGSVWASDAMAYFIGSKFGKHKIYPSMSPNKSWEGAFASIAGGALGALVFGLIFVKALAISEHIVTGMFIGVVAVIGDLVESMIKRDAGVKDSGAFIPGHGGILDKIDGSLYCGPVLVYMMSYFGIISGGFRLPF